MVFTVVLSAGLACLLLRLRYVAREVDPTEFAATPSGRNGARKFQVIEAANRYTDFSGIYFRVPENPPATAGQNTGGRALHLTPPWQLVSKIEFTIDI